MEKLISPPVFERAPEPSRQHRQGLNGVNEQLRQVVESLKSQRERLEQRVKVAAPPERPFTYQEDGVLRERLEDIERENLRLVAQFAALEDQTFHLTSLFVALHRLHESADRGEVMATLLEIIVNLVGSEQFAVFELDPEGKTLRLVHALGVPEPDFAEVRVGEELVGQVAAEGRPQLSPSTFRDRTVNACIPLRAGRRVTGALAIFDLLPHKSLLSSADLELLDVLSVHAGSALCLSAHEQRAKA